MLEKIIIVAVALFVLFLLYLFIRGFYYSDHRIIYVIFSLIVIGGGAGTYYFKKDLIMNLIHTVQNKIKSNKNKEEQKPEENKQEDNNKKQEENKDNKKEDKKDEKKEDPSLEDMLKRMKETSHGFGKEFKVEIASEQNMPNSFSFTVEYEGLKSEKYSVAKSSKKGQFEVISNLGKKDFDLYNNYGEDNAKFNKEVLNHLQMDNLSNGLKKAIKKKKVDFNKYADKDYFNSVNINYIKNKDISKDPLGETLLALTEGRDYITVAYSLNDSWKDKDTSKSKLDFFESIITKNTQQNLLLSLIDNEFIDEGSKKDFVVVLTNSRGKVNPKNFYIIFLVSIDEKNQIRYNEVKRST